MVPWRRSAFILLFAAGLGSWSFAQSTCDDYSAAAKAYADENWDEAIAGFQKCLDRQPDDAKLNFMVGFADPRKYDFIFRETDLKCSFNFISTHAIGAKLILVY